MSALGDASMGTVEKICSVIKTLCFGLFLISVFILLFSYQC